MLSKIKVADATREQLREFLIQVCGVPLAELPTNTGEEKLRSKLSQLHEGDEIVVSEPDAATLQHRAAANQAAAIAAEENEPFDLDKKPRYLTGVPTAQSGQHDPKVLITLTKTDDLERPADVSVNGRRMLVPRGEPVEIPYRFFLAIKAAVRTMYDDDGEGGQKPRDVPAHPYAVNRMPPARAIAEWDFYMLGTQKGQPEREAA